jgi:hypothetical protein
MKRRTHQNEKYRILAALCAAFLLTGTLGITALAVPEDTDPPETTALNPFTPDGTGTVLD